MRRTDARRQQTVPIDEISKQMSNRIAFPTDANRFHHAGISKLSADQRTIEILKIRSNERPAEKIEVGSSHVRRFVLVRFDASNEERLAGGENIHQCVERFLELGSERRRTFARVRTQLEFVQEKISQKRTFRFLKQFQQILAERVAIFLQET